MNNLYKSGRYDCFVSFCEQDVDRHDLSCFIDELRRRLEGNDINFHVYHEEIYGMNFDEYIDKLDTSRCAIILCTPEYKRRVDLLRDRNTGVYKEYAKIIERIEPSDDCCSNASTQNIYTIPVLWKGCSHQESIPKLFFGSSYCANLSDFHAHKIRGIYSLPVKLQGLLGETLDTIANNILSDKIQHEAEICAEGISIRNLMINEAQIGHNIRQEYEREIEKNRAAAFEPKFEQHEIDVLNFKQRYFVETAFFRSLVRHEHYIYSGRKGSGKTTLAQILIYDRSKNNIGKYSIHPIDVQVNDWNLYAIFDDVVINQISGDLSFIKNDTRIFTFAWTAFIAFSLIRELLTFQKCSLEEIGSIIHAKQVCEYFQDEKIQSERVIDRYRHLFYLSLQSIKFFTDHLIDKASSYMNTEEKFRFCLRSSFTLQKFSEFLFGAGFSELKRRLDLLGQGRILFCLDRFDTEIQNYRKNALHRLDKGDNTALVYLKREIDWLKGLVTVVSQAKSRDLLTPDTDIFGLFNRIDFFVVIPRDRLFEVQEEMRDSISVDVGIDVRWKPKELLTMLRKRLEVVANYDDKDLDRLVYKTPEDRFEYILKKYFSDLPEIISIRIEGKDFEIDLFLGVLRHTFWRPRDILIFYAPIIQRLIRHRSSSGRQRLDKAIIKQIIAYSTRELVISEFLQEFCDSIKNLKQIIACFKGKPQSFTYDEIKKELSSIDIDMVGVESKISKIEKKLNILYDIGFIGVKPHRQFGGVFAINDFTFSFMNRIEIIDFEAASLIEGATFAIHPVFIESLSLIPGANPGGGGNPVLYYDWNFIDQNDALELVGGGPN